MAARARLWLEEGHEDGGLYLAKPYCAKPEFAEKESAKPYSAKPYSAKLNVGTVPVT